ncbi:MAG: hypothetical protein R2852_02990 [Bacteroidia bacterium]
MNSNKLLKEVNMDSGVLIDQSYIQVSIQNLEILKNFALDYSSRPSIGSAFVLPETPDSVLNAVRSLKYTNPKEFEMYLTLIFVKYCRTWFECCRSQLYEPEIHTNPLIVEYQHMMKDFLRKSHLEFNASRIGYDYVKAHKYLLQFKPINKHYQQIKLLMTLEGA